MNRNSSTFIGCTVLLLFLTSFGAKGLEPLSTQRMSEVSGREGLNLDAQMALQIDELNLQDGSEGTLRLSNVFYGDISGAIGNRAPGEFDDVQVNIDGNDGVELDFGPAAAGDRLGFEIGDIYLGNPGGNSIGGMRIGGFNIGATNVFVQGTGDGIILDGELSGSVDSIDFRDGDGASCASCSGNPGVLRLGGSNGFTIDGGGSVNFSGVTIDADGNAGLVISFPDEKFDYALDGISVAQNVTSGGSNLGAIRIDGAKAPNTFLELRGQSGEEGLEGSVSAGITGDYLQLKDPSGDPDEGGNTGRIRFGDTNEDFIIDRDGEPGGSSARFENLTLDFDQDATINGSTQGAVVLTVPSTSCGGTACPDVGIDGMYMGDPSGSSIGDLDGENLSFDGTTLRVGANP